MELRNWKFKANIDPVFVVPIVPTFDLDLFLPGIRWGFHLKDLREVQKRLSNTLVFGENKVHRVWYVTALDSRFDPLLLK